MLGLKGYEEKDSLKNVIGGMAALALAMGIGRFAFTPILPLMQDAQGINDYQAGLIASANYFGYFAGSLLSMAVPDSLRKTVLRISVPACALLTLAMIPSSTMTWHIIIRFLTGLASGLAFVTISSAVLSTLGRRGHLGLSGLMYSGVGIGIYLSSVLTPAGKTETGAWLINGGAGVLMWIISALFIKDDIPASSQSSKEKGVHRKLLPLTTAYLLEGFAYIISATFIVAMVERQAGSVSGNSVWAVTGIAAALSTLFWSRLAGKTGFVKALIFAYAAQTAGLFIPAFSSTSAAAMAGGFLLGGTFIGIASMTVTYARQISPESPTAAIGLLTTAYSIGQIAGPYTAGIIAEKTGSFAPALTVSGIAAALSLVAMVYINMKKEAH
ncbi:YbfB/YjiJ family MFS transporter [Limisalsivibrio acetivorans]|uniref:YbfB/YjiJ family MFS transporter n=1 Tax=Limisalsivibrio acetivorans TaxID=1304888 RepID=UPI0003B64820|nr:YbfB/YjiJ family MFS transporter [Limisalsivibrio acetivorans]